MTGGDHGWRLEMERMPGCRGGLFSDRLVATQGASDSPDGWLDQTHGQDQSAVAASHFNGGRVQEAHGR